MKKIYIDTNIVCGIANQDYSEEIINGFFSILELKKAKKIELFTSKFTDEELSQIPEENRYLHKIIYLLIENVITKPLIIEKNQFVGIDIVGAQMVGKPLIGGIKENPSLLKRIRGIIPMPQSETKKRAWYYDTIHLYQCGENKCDLFWTEDRKTILKYEDELRNIGIIVIDTLKLKDHLTET